jgi:phosphohistidine phosphatase
MQLLIIRHADAGDKKEFAKTGKSDDLRPLSSDGKRQMARAARGLRTLVSSIDLLATSPLVRAKQTADIVATEYDISIGETTDVLRPETGFDDFIKWIASYADQEIVAVVGHEPHLSGLATWLMTGQTDSRIELKKGGACLLSCESALKKGKAHLHWLATARQLAQMD